MISQPVQQPFSAERRNFTERRRMCLLEYYPGHHAPREGRSGFDRRLAIRLQCRHCSRLLFATRDAERRLILSDRFSQFASAPGNSSYQCPCCGASFDRITLQQQQEELLLERLRFE